MWLAAGVLFIITLLFSYWWMGPEPPRRIIIATGEPEGAYAEIGAEFQRRLQKMGMRVELHASQGSVENVQLLLDKKVNVALVQAGVYSLFADKDKDERLRGLVAIQAEPVWVFYRGAPVQHLGEFRDRRRKIAVGQKNSGTAVHALALLRANGIDGTNADIVNLTMSEAAKQLKNGSIDVGFFVSSARNHLVDELLRCPNVRVLGFGRQLAYTRRFPYLTPVILGEGVVDLEKDIPPQDLKMFATSTLLLCRDDFHPQAVEQVLIAARRMHPQTPLVANDQTYPTLQGMDVTVHDTAQAYMLSGESLATKWLPYWGVWLLFKIQILLLPFLLVWLPFFRILPFVYRTRVNWLLRSHYAALRAIEDRIEKTTSAEVLQQQIKELDNLRALMDKVSRKIPTHLQINVYQWRLHVSHVRAEAADRLWRIRVEQGQAAEAAVS